MNGLLSCWLSHWTWVDRIDCIYATVLLSFHCIVIGRLVDGVFGRLSSCIHLSDGIRLLFIGQSVIGLDSIFLSCRCIFDGLFSCWLGRWGLWHIVDGLRALGLLSSDVFVGCRCIDSILSLSCFSDYLGLGCILLLTSQSIISFDSCLLSIGCLVDGILSVSLRCWRLWYGVDCVLAGVFLSCHVLVGCRCIDGIFCLLGFLIHLSFSCILLLASQSVVGLDCCLLISCSLVDGVLSISFRCWSLWNGVDSLRTLGLLSSYILVGCCCIDGILSFLGFFIHFSFGCVLLLTS